MHDSFIKKKEYRRKVIIVILNGHKISSLGSAFNIHFIPSFRGYLLFLGDPITFLDTRVTYMILSIRRTI
jgi:hypothetical protein